MLYNSNNTDQPLAWTILDMLADTVYRDNLPDEVGSDILDDVRAWAESRNLV